MSGLEFDPDEVSKILIDVAATEIMPRYRTLQKHELREKSPGDIVTIADERAEAAIAPRLERLLPGSVLVGEESAASDSKVIDRLLGSAPAWIVDPIDGTANFAIGKPDFCMMVALARQDELLAAWIYVPVDGRIAVAVTGQGVLIDNRPINSLGNPLNSEMTGVVAVGTRGGKDLVARAEILRRHSRAVRSLRCAGLDYLRLAAGEIDFVLFSGVMPWDHAPGIAIVRELGGVASYASGDQYRPSLANSAKGVLAARDRDIWERVLDHLNPARHSPGEKLERKDR